MSKPDSANKKVQTTLEVIEVIAVEETTNEAHQTEIVDSIDVNSLFPDPEEFAPISPDFSFPPLPPTPPELDETETITSSTILKTAIEVLPKQLEDKKKSSKKDKKENAELQPGTAATTKKNSKQEEIKKTKTDKPKSDKKTSILVDKRNKTSNKEGKRHKKEDLSHLKVPQVQLQVSSEREIVDSIVVIKNKAERKEEKQALRKSKRKKDKRDQVLEDQEHLLNCRECQEEKVRKRREREMIRSDGLGKNIHFFLFHFKIHSCKF